MARRSRLLVWLMFLATVGLVWPSDAAAQRGGSRGTPGGAARGGPGGAPRGTAGPAPRGAGHTGVAVPRTYQSRGYGSHYSPGYSYGHGYPRYAYGSGYPRYAYGYGYPRYAYGYGYSSYYYPYYSGFSFGFGLGWGGGFWGGYGYGSPYYGSYGSPYYGSPYYAYPSNEYPSNGYPSNGYPSNGYPVARPTVGYQGSAPAPAQRASEPTEFGSLSIRVIPSDAAILVDGEAWDRPQGESRFSIDLAEGPHQVEVRKEGFRPYIRTVDILGGRAFTLNVSLTPGGSGGQRVSR